MTHDPVAPLRVDILGRPRILLGNNEISPASWQRRSAGELLFFLLTSEGRRATQTSITQALWPVLDHTAGSNALDKSVHALRQLLQPGLATGRTSSYLRRDPDGLRISPTIVCTVDADLLDQLGDRVRQTSLVPIDQIEKVLALCRGDALEGVAPAAWVVTRREIVRECRFGLVVEFLRKATLEGQPPRAIPALEALLRDDPRNVPARRLVIQTLASSGRAERALHHYETWRNDETIDPERVPDEEIEQLRLTLLNPPAPGSPIASPPSPDLNYHLPTPPNPLIGRKPELSYLTERLASHDVRLVTITGAGGTGKTHLAMGAGAGLRAEFEDRVAFISFGPLRYPDLVLPAILSGLRLADDGGGNVARTIAEAIGQRRVLLILDNFEHLLAAAPEVATLLSACPHLRILATSRERLNIRGEHRLELEPLPTPDLSAADSLEQFSEVPSVRLFCSRIEALDPRFRLTVGTAPLVDEICRRLNGLPLALELAAARIDHLSLAQIRDGLNDQRSLLTGGPGDAPTRHQTITACIAWSEQLLAPDARVLFRRLSLLDGHITSRMLDWIARIGFPSPEVAEPELALISLVNSSLVTRTVHGDDLEAVSRFDMVETIRTYGRTRLDAAGERRLTNQAVLRALRDMVIDAELSFTSPMIGVVLDELETLRPTVDLALAYGFSSEVTGDQAMAEELAAGMVLFWGERGGFREATRWFAPLLELPDAASLGEWVERNDESARRRAKALRRGAMLLYDADRFDDAIRFAEQTIRLSEILEDLVSQSNATEILAGIASARGDHPYATTLADRAVTLAIASGKEYRQLIAEINRLMLVTTAGDLNRATKLGQEVLGRAQAAEDPDSIAHVAITLTSVHLARRDLGAAAESIGIAEQAATLVDSQHYHGQILTFQGWLSWLDGDFEAAEHAFSEAVAAHRQIDDWIVYILESLQAQGIAALRLGRIEQASRLIDEATTGYRGSPELRGHLASLIEDLIAVATPSGAGHVRFSARLAAQLLGASGAIRRETGERRPVLNLPEFDGAVAVDHLGRELGRHRFQEHFAAGKQLGTDQFAAAIHQLVQSAWVAQDPANIGPLADPADVLSTREYEVLILLAQGKRSADIATDLFVSERTIHAHLRTIYQKLDVPNRAAAIRWSFDNGYVRETPAHLGKTKAP